MTTDPVPELRLDEFPAFFADLWAGEDGAGPPCFAWQLELTEQIARERRWPSLVDLPTGTGKTSLLELAIFQMALDAERPPAERWMPRRVVLVVDRRVVVDQAAERGRAIGRRLAEATNNEGVLGRVAARLRHLSAAADDEPPLVASVLRGGIVRDETWAQRPDVPAVISSTVDQVGSRLLFRGYGLSAAMRPVHAALLAHDCLFLLDEVHLARPFARSLAALDRYRAQAPETVMRGADRWQVVEMTATPTADNPGTRFPAAPLDPESHPVLRRRLTASKPARLEAVALPAHAAQADRLFGEACVAAATTMLGEPTATVVGVIVNRVTTARSIAQRLSAQQGEDGAEVLLLTGRMRPYDRDRALEEHRLRLVTGRWRDTDAKPLVVVATQCIEAGADFDLDAIVTECASLDALRQRFGRVDRDGRRSEADAELTSVILARGPQVVAEAEDPVYGRALERTWAWLTKDDRADVDFGLSALELPEPAVLTTLVPALRDAPVMLPAHLDAWARTYPAPALEPDVSRWLHGIQTPDPEVQLLWRWDLDPAWLTGARPDGGSPSDVDRHRAAVAHVESCPPVTSEALSLPLSAARRWLRGEPEGDTFDVEGVPAETTAEAREPGPRRAVRWTGSGAAEVVDDKHLRPGDVLVVPSAYGGLTLGSWDPAAREAVADVAAEATRARRGLVVLRLVRAVRPESGAFPDRDAWEQSTKASRRAALDVWLDARANHADPGLRRDIRDILAAPARLRQERLIERLPTRPADPPETLVLTAPARNLDASDARRRRAPLDAEGDLDAASFIGVEGVTLARHLAGVATWVSGLAARAGLRPELAADLELAAWRHDLGKADPRFQVWLHDGDELAAAGASEPLAKSPGANYDRAARERARALSGYPPGTRHELLSLAMSQSDAALTERAHDRELVLHLIAAHHGRCRPFAPVAHDLAPVHVAYEHAGRRWEASSAHRLEGLDAGVPERYAALTERYGWYGLAWLETLLRLADHGRSAQEQALAEEAG